MWIPIPAVEMNQTFLSFRMKKQKLKRASRRTGTLSNTTFRILLEPLASYHFIRFR